MEEQTNLNDENNNKKQVLERTDTNTNTNTNTNTTNYSGLDAEEADRKRAARQRREEIKRKIEQKKSEREKRKEEYNKLSLFEKLMADDDDDSDESEMPNLSSSSSDEGDDNSEVKTARLLTANVGTSKKNSNSIRNVKMNKSQSLLSMEESELAKSKAIKKKRQKSVGDADGEDENASNKFYLDYESDGVLSSGYSDFFNTCAETFTILQEDDQYRRVIDDNLDSTSRLPQISELHAANMKQMAITVLLSQKWSNKTKDEKKRKESKAPIIYQPTFKMKPDINLSIMQQQIIGKVKQTFETLCSKHQYDVEYTPRFLRVITEMVKNDVKTFKLDRYKILTHVTILKKMLGQSVYFISKMLWNGNDDYRLCIRSENKTFIAVCLIFLVYRE